MRLLPIRLRPDNFTPPTRTPWGGTRLLGHYKAGLGIRGIDPKSAVGESWELSSGDEFPSATESGERLSEVFARDLPGYLGDEAQNGQPETALVVKWLDAADNLSLQIHPHDDYAALAANEAGKLECWYIVERDPGAGIYFGFAAGASERDVRSALESGADLTRAMRFVPVERGDFFLLEPGTPHAVGKGLCLIEPQTVKPGHRGLTYRYWDFGRRYDARGKLDPRGAARPLHVEHALAVTRWDRAGDSAWLDSRKLACGVPDLDSSARCELLCGPADARIASNRLRVARVVGSGSVPLPAWNALRALTVIEGELTLVIGRESFAVAAGTTVAVPAGLTAITAELARAHAILSAACLAGC